MSIKKTIVKILFCWIPHKNLRKKCRDAVLNMNFNDSVVLLRFALRKKQSKSILMLDTNDFHAEIIPGLIKYWRDLGYHVDVVYSEIVAKEKPLCRYRDKNIRSYPLSIVGINLLAKFLDAKEYEKVMLNTSMCCFYREDEEKYVARKIFKKIPADKFILIEHDLHDIERMEETEFLKNKRVVSLLRFEMADTVMVNPHFFGAVKVTPKNEMVNFVVVGGIQAKRKNHKLMFDAVAELVKAGYENFRVIVVGRGKIEDVPVGLRKYFTLKGRLDFPKMYEVMEHADFYLTLLDEQNDDHKRYITSGVTGSFQLVLGFVKPCLISKTFADFYGLDNQNSIVYEDNDLLAGMKRALEIDAAAYGNLQKNLEELAKRVYAESLMNLQNIIKKQ